MESASYCQIWVKHLIYRAIFKFHKDRIFPWHLIVNILIKDFSVSKLNTNSASSSGPHRLFFFFLRSLSFPKNIKSIASDIIMIIIIYIKMFFFLSHLSWEGTIECYKLKWYLPDLDIKREIIWQEMRGIPSMTRLLQRCPVKSLDNKITLQVKSPQKTLLIDWSSARPACSLS